MIGLMLNYIGLRLNYIGIFVVLDYVLLGFSLFYTTDEIPSSLRLFTLHKDKR